MKRMFGLMAAISFCLSGCLPVRPNVNPPQITQLQARAIQTRVYDGLDRKDVMKAVLNVLQDEGFLVRYGDMELGLLSADKELVELDRTNFYGQFTNSLSNNDAALNSVSNIQATVNISEFGKRIKVRASFQRKVLSNNVPTFLFFTFGPTPIPDAVDVTQINDPKFYQEFFVKVDKGLFIQNEGL